MKISAVSPNAQNYSKVSFGLRTDKATQDLVLNSKISKTAKILFKNMLLDRNTDRFTITIKEKPVEGFFDFVLGLKDSKYPLAKEERKGFEAFNDHVVISAKDDLAELVGNLYYPERFDSYGKELEFISDTNLKQIHRRMIGVSTIAHPLI